MDIILVVMVKNKEDTTMKKMISNIKTLAALLMAGAAFTACSSSDDMIEQPVKPTEPQVYTMVVKASKGGDATTRALQDNGTSGIKAYWSGDETIEVVQGTKVIGTATAAASETGATTITATLTTAPDPDENLSFWLGGANHDYTGQVGLLTGTNSISEKYDYNSFVLSSDCNYTVTGTVIETEKTLEFGADQAIVKFTLSDGENAIKATKFNIHSKGGNLVQKGNVLGGRKTTYGDITISPAGTTNVIYAALKGWGGVLDLTANDGNNVYTCTTNEKVFHNGCCYAVPVTMTKILTRISSSNAISVFGCTVWPTKEEAQNLAKECWTVAGNTVYVVYEASGTIATPDVKYVSYDGATLAEGEATSTSQLSPLYGGGSNTAWYVEPES